ncbi:MAG: frataxin domain-containing protein, partial [Pseudomonadota bacterium]
HEGRHAARRGGYPYRFDATAWRHTRDGSEFIESLSQRASDQAGRALRF